MRQMDRLARVFGGVLLAATLLTSYGCNDGGLVEGTVRDSRGRPVEGARVRISNPDDHDDPHVVRTDENGYFESEFSGFGRFKIAVEADGYARALVDVVRERDGESLFLNDHGVTVDVVIYPRIAALQGHVTRDAVNGFAPIEAANVRVRLRDETIVDPALVLDGTTNEDGFFMLEELPAGAAITLFVDPVDVNGDRVLDTALSANNLSLPLSGAMAQTLVVGDYDPSPRILWTNADGSILLESDAELRFLFSVPMVTDLARTDVTLVVGSRSVPFTAAWNEDADVLTVTPASALNPGDTHSVSVTARTASDDDRSVSGVFTFRVRGAAQPNAPQNLAVFPNPVNFARGQFGWLNATTAVALEWDAVEGADAYRVYAREQGGTPETEDWSRLEELSTSGGALVQVFPQARREQLGIPGIFREGGQLFTRGEELQFAVSAVTEDEEGPLSAAFGATSEQCPQASAPNPGVESGQASSSWRVSATGDEPRNVYIEVAYDEPVLASSTLSITVSGLPAIQWTPQFRSPLGTGYLIVRLIATLPLGTDATGRSFTIDLSGVRNTSGNADCTNPANQVSGTTPG